MSTSTPDTLEKQEWEKRQYSIDFSALMSSSETISSISSITSARLGGDGTSDLTISDYSISGNTITFWIEGGTNRYRYKIEGRIITSAGQQLEVDGILRVID